MNGLRSKLVRLRAKELLLQWMQSLVDEDSASKYTLKNVLSFSPKQTHLYYNDGSYHLSAYTFKWFTHQVKKLSKTKEIADISIEDCKEVSK